MPSLQEIQDQVDLAKESLIGGLDGAPILQTVKERASQSPIPSAFTFGVSILSVEGRIADPAAFRNGWLASNGPEKSPWQIHPRWHDFAKNTPADNFPAYTDYAFSLLEDGYLETGTLFGAARRYNSFNACEEGRGEACRNGRDYARAVTSRLPKVQTALKRAGFEVGPDVSSQPVGGGGGPILGGGIIGGGDGGSEGLGLGATLLIAGALGGTIFFVADSAGDASPRRR
jgi:hypothetical protein